MPLLLFCCAVVGSVTVAAFVSVGGGVVVSIDVPVVIVAGVLAAGTVAAVVIVDVAAV